MSCQGGGRHGGDLVSAGSDGRNLLCQKLHSIPKRPMARRISNSATTCWKVVITPKAALPYTEPTKR